MKTLDLRQGTAEWLAARKRHFTASEAAAMLGLSDKVTRSELLQMKATGTEQAFSDWVQKHLLDRGHQVEADTRPWAEQQLGEELYPATGVLDVDGLPLLASFDGINLMETVCWENKLWNEKLVNYVRSRHDLPDTHWPQLEQQLLVSGAESVLFTISDGQQQLAFRYVSSEARRAWLIGGWQQFARDLAEYQPKADADTPLTGKMPDTLPALRIDITGAVTASNLAEFKTVALAAIRRVNRTLESDQDFADAEQAVKWCEEVETRLKAAKEHALGQTASIDQLFKAIDDISAEARKVRLDLEKLVKQRKEAIRDGILIQARQQLATHLASLNQRIGKPYMPDVVADFASAIKGKRTLASLQDAADTELARAKIEANAIADKLAANLNTLQALAVDHLFLFADEALIVHKSPDDLALLIKSRIDSHQQTERERQQREAITMAMPATAADDAPVADLFTHQTPAANPAAVPRGTPTLRLGMINDRLGFTVSVQLLANLGFTATQEGSARLYHEADFLPICKALIAHIDKLGQRQQEAA